MSISTLSVAALADKDTFQCCVQLTGASCAVISAGPVEAEFRQSRPGLSCSRRSDTFLCVRLCLPNPFVIERSVSSLPTVWLVGRQERHGMDYRSLPPKLNSVVGTDHHTELFGVLHHHLCHRKCVSKPSVLLTLDESRPATGLLDRKSTRLNSSHSGESRMPSSA